jgi:Zn-dependent protease
MDPFGQGIPLGRWFHTTVIMSFTHIIILLIFGSQVSSQGPIVVAAVVSTLFLSILLHEFGHVIACRLVGGQADVIVLGFGGMAYVRPPERPLPQFITTAGGPLVNGILLAIAWALHASPLWGMLWGGNGMLFLRALIVAMIYINKMLLVLNLLPIFPMDGGRLLQHVLWAIVGYRNSMVVTGMIGTVGGAALLILGTGATSVTIPIVNEVFGNGPDMFLVVIGLQCAMQSWTLYSHAKRIGDYRQR